VPLLVLAIAMLPLLIVPLLVDLPRSAKAMFVALDWFIWSAFALEYVAHCERCDVLSGTRRTRRRRPARATASTRSSDVSTQSNCISLDRWAPRREGECLA
jgi:hypothetical protein